VSRERLRLSWALLLVGACLLVYANGLTGAFTYDDKAIVRDNLRIRTPSRTGEIFATQYFGGSAGTGTAYRPLLLLSFAVQWWIHGGDPLPFHAVNVLLHASATLLLAALFLRLGIRPPTAVGAALLFAVHPIHVEAVAGVVGRGESQAAALVLTALLLALRFADGGRRRWLALSLSLLAGLAANLTKESASVAPALLFLCLAWKAPGSLAARSRSALRKGLAFYAGSAAALGLVFALRARVLGGALKAGHTGIFELENALAPLTPLVRAANACALFVRLLGRLVLPLRLSSDESAWSIRPLGGHDLLAWAGAALVVALVASALWRFREGSIPSFGFLFLGVAALPASNLLFPTGTIFAERLAYLPSAGLCLIAAAWIVNGFETFAALPRARLAVLAAAVVALGARTIVRNAVWASDEALFTNMVRVSPASAKAHYDFAYMSAETGKPRRALEHYRKATEIYPAYWDAWAGRGRVERELGDPAAAERAYLEALRIHPGYENGYFGLGLSREARADPEGAEAAYREGLRGNPRSLPLAYRLALLLSSRGRPEALFAWRRALAIEPRSIASQRGLKQWAERRRTAPVSAPDDRAGAR
jgi:tetratricopeptide (TPR) repeat protein